VTHFTVFSCSWNANPQKARLQAFARRYSALTWLVSKYPFHNSSTTELACASFLAADFDFGARLRAWIESGTGDMPDLAALHAGNKKYVLDFQATLRHLAVKEAPRRYWRPDESSSKLLALQKQSPVELLERRFSAGESTKLLKKLQDIRGRDRLPAAESCRYHILDALINEGCVDMQSAWDKIANVQGVITEKRYQDYTQLYIVFVDEWQKLVKEFG